MELPAQVDVIRINRECQERRILVGTGPFYSFSPKFSHHLALSFSHPWSEEIEKGIGMIGALAKKQLAGRK